MIGNTCTKYCYKYIAKNDKKNCSVQTHNKLLIESISRIGVQEVIGNYLFQIDSNLTLLLNPNIFYNQYQLDTIVL